MFATPFNITQRLTCTYPEWDWTKILRSGNVALIVIPEYYSLPSSVKFREAAWVADLATSTIANVALEKDELMTFLEKHTSTIEYIFFQKTVLFDTHLQDPRSTGMAHFET